MEERKLLTNRGCWACVKKGVIPKWQLNWALADLGKKGGEVFQGEKMSDGALKTGHPSGRLVFRFGAHRYCGDKAAKGP